jgi:hypothetical protein
LILRYVYSTATGSKQLAGCVCRLDNGRLGYSAIHPHDRRKVSRKLARTIALGLAEKCDIVYAYGFWHKTRGRFANITHYDVPAAIVPYLAAIAE